MASTATFLSTLTSSATKAGLTNSSSSPSGGSKVVRFFLPAQIGSRRWRAVVPRAAVSGTEKARAPKGEGVVQVHSVEEFDAALTAAKNRLVVVEFAASHSVSSSRIYPTMVQLSRTCGDVDFLLVMGDESEATRELCRREGVAQVPHFAFYKGAEKVHGEDGIGPDQLAGDVLYYGDNHQAVVQLNWRADVEALIDGNHGKLVVLDVGPCVKVLSSSRAPWPTPPSSRA
jgi:hypothetical protein